MYQGDCKEMEDQRKGQTTATDLAEAEAEGEEEHRMYENVWRDDLQRRAERGEQYCG